jgi:hypothetical protein
MAYPVEGEQVFIPSEDEFFGADINMVLIAFLGGAGNIAMGE